jgi:hypothetical protein
MAPKLNTEKIIYACVIALSLIALLLIACSPSYFLAGKVVYQGF